jgi:hypothetical protein
MITEDGIGDPAGSVMNEAMMYPRTWSFDQST